MLLPEATIMQQAFKELNSWKTLALFLSREAQTTTVLVQLVMELMMNTIDYYNFIIWRRNSKEFFQSKF